MKERDLEREKRQWLHKHTEISLAYKGLVEQELQRIAARFELESDEFYTWRQKAERMQEVTK